MGAPVLLYVSPDAERTERDAADLGQAGFEVHRAAPGKARPLAEDLQPDATVVDMVEGGEACIELVVWLRETRPYRDDPCFVDRADRDVRRVLSSRANGIRYVSGDLVEGVREAFKGRMGFMVKDPGRGATRDDDMLIV